MSVITASAVVMSWLEEQSWGIRRYDTTETSDVNGQTAVLVQAPPRWTSTLRSARGLSMDVAGEWESMLLKLEGQVNHLAVWDVLAAAVSPQRAPMYLAAAAAVGDTSIVVNNAIGTFDRGTPVQIGSGLGTSQYLRCTDPVTSAVAATGVFTWTNGAPAFSWTNGASAFTWQRPGAQVTLNFRSRLRDAYPAGTLVYWDKPVCYFKLETPGLTWQSRANGPAKEGFAVDLLEHWS